MDASLPIAGDRTKDEDHGEGPADPRQRIGPTVGDRDHDYTHDDERQCDCQCDRHDDSPLRVGSCFVGWQARSDNWRKWVLPVSEPLATALCVDEGGVLLLG